MPLLGLTGPMTALAGVRFQMIRGFPTCRESPTLSPGISDCPGVSDVEFPGVSEFASEIRNVVSGYTGTVERTDTRYDRGVCPRWY